MAGFAGAAVWVPFHAAWALIVGDVMPLVVSDVSQRFTKANAHAVARVPNVAGITLLHVAGAFALVSIPVVAVVDAVLDGTNESAARGVKRVDNTILGVRSLEGALAFASGGIEVVAFFSACLVRVDNERATLHVPALTSRSGSGRLDASAQA